MNSINLFDSLKIYRIDLVDNHLKKFNLISENGFLEIQTNDDSENLNVFLFSIESSSRLTYLNCRLDQLDLKLLTSSQNRIEFIKLDKNLKWGYSVDFLDINKRNEFQQLVKNLDEIFLISSKIRPANDEIIEMDGDFNESNIDLKSLEELCYQFQNSVRNGEIEQSVIFAKELARRKAIVEINFKKDEITQINNQETLNRVVVYLDNGDKNSSKKLDLLLPANQFTVMDLKVQISAYFRIKPEDQILVLNDFNASDVDLIDAYRVDRPITSSNKDNSNDFFAIIYLKSQNAEIDNLISNAKDQNQENDQKCALDNYSELTAYYNQDINENFEPFDCDICLEKNIAGSQGVILKECLHVFCKDCLRDYINHSDEPIIKCPFNKDYKCEYALLDREIRALITSEDYTKYEMKSLRISEASMLNTFHCKTLDCIGFCISEDNLNFFYCPVCDKVNCLSCNVIHMGKTCKEYQDDIKLKTIHDKNELRDNEALQNLIAQRKAMYCPGCKIVVTKQEGCDWLQCSMCKIEICWATRGPRWGPGGHGDTSGGCKCSFLAGKLCHPNCGNCH
ncbi:unnamed protein product [Brachionus calyciflorus]|uniref:Uncharacterized protein n=1 Tax=Brachionus calyciflorus TaxID=104777 RepID=A0A813NIM7_9BILA|nr:unnamed protein product [Brachionus calyciflorus]